MDGFGSCEAFGVQPPSLADWASNLFAFFFVLARYHGSTATACYGIFFLCDLPFMDWIPYACHEQHVLASMYVCIDSYEQIPLFQTNPPYSEISASAIRQIGACLRSSLGSGRLFRLALA